MSFILDALKKAGHDEKGETIPGIDSHHEYAEEDDEAGIPFLWLLVIGLLLINLVVLTWLFWPDSPDDNSVVVSANQTRPEFSNLEQPVTEPAPERGITVREKRLDPVRNPLTEKEVAVPTRRPTTQRQAVNTAPVAVSSERPATVSSQRSDVADAPPSLDQMPETFQAEVPEINYSTHVFADQASRRFVMFNGKALSQGERTSDGILVKTIEEQRVILEFQGQTFVLDALTNWRLE